MSLPPQYRSAQSNKTATAFATELHSTRHNGAVWEVLLRVRLGPKIRTQTHSSLRNGTATIDHTNRSAGRMLMLCATRRQIAGQRSRCLMLEQHLDTEVNPQPVLKVGNEKHGRRGIHAQPGKFRLRVDAFGREIEAFGEIRHAPINDLGFGRLRFQAGARAMPCGGAVNAMFWPCLQGRMGVPLRMARGQVPVGYRHNCGLRR